MIGSCSHKTKMFIYQLDVEYICLFQNGMLMLYKYIQWMFLIAKLLQNSFLILVCLKSLHLQKYKEVSFRIIGLNLLKFLDSLRNQVSFVLHIPLYLFKDMCTLAPGLAQQTQECKILKAYYVLQVILRQITVINSWTAFIDEHQSCTVMV